MILTTTEVARRLHERGYRTGGPEARRTDTPLACRQGLRHGHWTLATTPTRPSQRLSTDPRKHQIRESDSRRCELAWKLMVRYVRTELGILIPVLDDPPALTVPK